MDNLGDKEKGELTVYYLTGFGSLASLVASDVDHTTAIYKRFDKLAARNLLYYQSQLSEYEALQDGYDIEDAQDGNNTTDPVLRLQIRRNARDWASFERAALQDSSVPSDRSTTNMNSAYPSNSTEPPLSNRWRKRMDLAMKIRCTLRDYREALTLDSALLSLRSPSRQTMTGISKSFHIATVDSHGQPATTSTLMGNSSDLYSMETSETNANDYISTSNTAETDLLSYLLKSYCSRLFRLRQDKPSTAPGRIIHTESPQLCRYSLNALNCTVSFMTTTLAAILLFLPIYVLNQVSDSQPNLAMGLIALFTILFAAAIALVTNARRSEIFGSCAAYAAVLVVFVSGNFGQRSNS